MSEQNQKMFGQALVGYNASKAILTLEYLSTIFNHKSVSDFQIYLTIFGIGRSGFQGLALDEMLN